MYNRLLLYKKVTLDQTTTAKINIIYIYISNEVKSGANGSNSSQQPAANNNNNIRHQLHEENGIKSRLTQVELICLMSIFSLSSIVNCEMRRGNEDEHLARARRPTIRFGCFGHGKQSKQRQATVVEAKVACYSHQWNEIYGVIVAVVVRVLAIHLFSAIRRRNRHIFMHTHFVSNLYAVPWNVTNIIHTIHKYHKIWHKTANAIARECCYHFSTSRIDTSTAEFLSTLPKPF